MTGDVVDIFGKSFWHNGTGSNPNNNYLITSALNSFINSFAGTSAVAGAGKGATATALNNSTATTGGLNNWLNSVPNPNSASVPKAYINWILLDEQFKPISSGSGFDAVSASADALNNHHKTVNVNTCGYLYVYCSNESNLDVFFDNLQVVHTRGPLLETDNYYPFGLIEAAISYKAAGSLKNKYLYNDGTELQNKEFGDGRGLEIYATNFRSLDPQLGRFWQIDPFAQASDYCTPYAYAENNPILLNDPSGLRIDSTITPIQPPNKLGFEPGSYKILPEVVVTSIKKSSKDYEWYEFFNDHKPGGDFLYQLNKWNPLANLINGINTYITGHDTYGVKQSNTEATVQIATIIPIERVGLTFVNISLAQIKEGIAKTLLNPNDFSHILKSKHDLDLLLTKAGSESNIIRRLYLSLGQSGNLPSTGEFKSVVNIYGYNVTIKGAVVDGIPRIGTAYIP